MTDLGPDPLELARPSWGRSDLPQKAMLTFFSAFLLLSFSFFCCVRHLFLLSGGVDTCFCFDFHYFFFRFFSYFSGPPLRRTRPSAGPAPPTTEPASPPAPPPARTCSSSGWTCPQPGPVPPPAHKGPDPPLRGPDPLPHFLVGPRCFFNLLATKAKFGSGRIPTLMSPPVSISTLCVSRQRSSPLSSVLSGIDVVGDVRGLRFLLTPSLCMGMGRPPVWMFLVARVARGVSQILRMVRGERGARSLLAPGPPQASSSSCKASLQGQYQFDTFVGCLAGLRSTRSSV